MTTGVADDYEAISRRLKQLRQGELSTECTTCQNSGWVVTRPAEIWDICPKCGNPGGKNKP